MRNERAQNDRRTNGSILPSLVTLFARPATDVQRTTTRIELLREGFTAETVGTGHDFISGQFSPCVSACSPHMRAPHSSHS
jgi:hypothetical protein